MPIENSICAESTGELEAAVFHIHVYARKAQPVVDDSSNLSGVGVTVD